MRRVSFCPVCRNIFYDAVGTCPNCIGVVLVARYFYEN